MPDLIHDHPVAKQLDQYTFDDLTKHLESDFVNVDPDKLTKTSPFEISKFLSRLDVDQQRKFFKKLSEKNASNILAEMDADDSAEIIMSMRELRAAKIIELLDPDDAADLLGKLEKHEQVRILAKIDKEKTDILRKLLRYDPDTAGGVMNPEIITLQSDWSVNKAIDRLRKNSRNAENLYDIYVLDKYNKIIGITTLRNLIFSDPNEKVIDITNTKIKQICCYPEYNKMKVVDIMSKYNIMDVPVIDDHNRLLGHVTHDDVLDIIQEAATSELQQLHGAGADESIHDKIIEGVKKRNPWLLINLILAFVSAYIISRFSTSIVQVTWVAAFMTVITNLAGNTGAQTMSVVIRSIALKEYRNGEEFIICRRELLKGFINGIIVGFIAGIISASMTNDYAIGIVVFYSMILTMLLSGFIAALIPISLKKLRFDPAQSSFIFLTAFTDIAGLIIFLKLSTYFLIKN